MISVLYFMTAALCPLKRTFSWEFTGRLSSCWLQFTNGKPEVGRRYVSGLHQIPAGEGSLVTQELTGVPCHHHPHPALTYSPGALTGCWALSLWAPGKQHERQEGSEACRLPTRCIPGFPFPPSSHSLREWEVSSVTYHEKLMPSSNKAGNYRSKIQTQLCVRGNRCPTPVRCLHK